MTEAEFQARVTDAARALGWKVFHTPQMKRAAAGFPDLALARRGRVLLVELKSAQGATSAAQDEWLRAAGEHARVWRPRDWDALLQELA